MAADRSVKFVLLGETKRARLLATDASGPGAVVALRRLCLAAFPVLADVPCAVEGGEPAAPCCDGQCTAADCFKLQYVDDEGDQITVSTDGDILEAFSVAESMGLKALKLAVVLPAGVEEKVKAFEARGSQRLITSVSTTVSAEAAAAVGGSSAGGAGGAPPPPAAAPTVDSDTVESAPTRIAAAPPVQDAPVPPPPAGAPPEAAPAVADEAARGPPPPYVAPASDVAPLPADEAAVAAEVMPSTGPDSEAVAALEAMAVSGAGDDAPMAKFVKHRTEFEIEPLVRGAPVTEVWTLRNSGRVRWPEGTRLVHVGGARLSAPQAGAAVTCAAPGEVVDVRMDLVIPAGAGRHVGYFRLTTPDGVRFGDRVWADITIDAADSAPPAPSAPPAEPASAAAPAGASPADRDAAGSAAPGAPPSSGSDGWATVARRGAHRGAGAARGGGRRAPAATTGRRAPPARRGGAGDYSAQEARLQEMGFTDREVNLDLLRRFKGNVSTTLERLMEMGSG